MALDDNDISNLAKAFKEAMKGDGSMGKALNEKDVKTLSDMVKEYDKFTSKIKDAGNKYSLLNKALAGQQTIAGQVREELEELDKAIENTADSYDRSVLQEKRQNIEKAASHAQFQQSMASLGQSLTKISGAMFSGMGNFVKGLQGNSSGIDLASGIMTTGLDIAGQTSHAMGEAAGSMGQVMMNSTNPKVKALGMAAAVAGPLIGSLGESASKLAKFGVEVLQKEVEKTVKAFNTASSSGAMFADGMTGLRQAANGAGLTVDQFSGVLQKHSADLAAAGLGVTEGAKRVGGALNAGGPQMKTQLMKLGYSFEEQAGLVAETMKDMRGSGGPLKAGNAEVAAQTQKYAENLRTISAITGEDAKKKMDQVRNQANQLAFQQKLAGMDETQRKGVMNAMANMSDMERKNFMDMVNFGAVINKEGAAAGAMSDGLTNSVNSYYDAFNKGTLDDIEARKIQAQNTDQIKQDMLNNTGVALAGAAGVGGLTQALSESMGKELEFRNAWTKEAIDAASTGVQAQKNANDKLTESVVGAELAAQNLKLAIEKELTPAIGKFAEVAKEILSDLQKTLKSLGLGEGPKEGPGFWDKMKGAGAKALEYGTTGATVGGVAGTVIPGVGNATGALVGGIGGALVGAWKGWMDTTEGKSVGGVSTGSKEGFIEKLHGSELIVPLDDSGKIKPNTVGYTELLNRVGSMAPAGGVGATEKPAQSGGLLSTIAPVLAGIANPLMGMGMMLDKMTEGSEVRKNVDETMTTTFGDMKKVMEDLKTTAQAQLNKHEEMVRHLSDNKDISERLLNASY